MMMVSIVQINYFEDLFISKRSSLGGGDGSLPTSSDEGELPASQDKRNSLGDSIPATPLIPSTQRSIPQAILSSDLIESSVCDEEIHITGLAKPSIARLNFDISPIAKRVPPPSIVGNSNTIPKPVSFRPETDPRMGEWNHEVIKPPSNLNPVRRDGMPAGVYKPINSLPSKLSSSKTNYKRPSQFNPPPVIDLTDDLIKQPSYEKFVVDLTNDKPKPLSRPLNSSSLFMPKKKNQFGGPSLQNPEKPRAQLPSQFSKPLPPGFGDSKAYQKYRDPLKPSFYDQPSKMELKSEPIVSASSKADVLSVLNSIPRELEGEMVEQPCELSCTLMPHQLVGYNFYIFISLTDTIG
jgi:hypothetical protein